MSEIEAYLQQQTNLSGRSAYDADQPLELWQTQLRTHVRERLGDFPAVPVALNPVVLERVPCDGYIRERIEITTYTGLRMPIYLLMPKNESATDMKRPAIVACHGHGYG